MQWSWAGEVCVGCRLEPPSSFTPGSASVWRGPSNEPHIIKSYSFSNFSNHSWLALKLNSPYLITPFLQCLLQIFRDVWFLPLSQRGANCYLMLSVALSPLRKAFLWLLKNSMLYSSNRENFPASTTLSQYLFSYHIVDTDMWQFKLYTSNAFTLLNMLYHLQCFY